MADGLALGSQLWLDWKLDVLKAKTKHTNVAIHFCRFDKSEREFFRWPQPPLPLPTVTRTLTILT